MKQQKSFQAVGSEASSGNKGKLYIVGTPIGNLEDMTYRAIRTLKEADLIAAEDTRQTRKLLTHFDIHTRLVSYHEHNKTASGPELIRLMQEGSSIALVSDAGMPAISDPGADLVREAVENSIPVIPVPGANAALSALVMSGLPTDGFLFAGFLPRDKKSAAKRLEQLAGSRETVILYESPHRLRKTLELLLHHWGDRRIAVTRELTKKHEEAIRGTISEAIAWFGEHDPLGEFCIVAEGADPDKAGGTDGGAAEAWWTGMELEQHVAHYEASMSRKDAIKQTAQDRGLPKRDVYNEVNR